MAFALWADIADRAAHGQRHVASEGGVKEVIDTLAVDEAATTPAAEDAAFSPRQNARPLQGPNDEGSSVGSAAGSRPTPRSSRPRQSRPRDNSSRFDD